MFLVTIIRCSGNHQPNQQNNVPPYHNQKPQMQHQYQHPNQYQQQQNPAYSQPNQNKQQVQNQHKQQVQNQTNNQQMQNPQHPQPNQYQQQMQNPQYPQPNQHKQQMQNQTNNPQMQGQNTVVINGQTFVAQPLEKDLNPKDYWIVLISCIILFPLKNYFLDNMIVTGLIIVPICYAIYELWAAAFWLEYIFYVLTIIRLFFPEARQEAIFSLLYFTIFTIFCCIFRPIYAWPRFGFMILTGIIFSLFCGCILPVILPDLANLSPIYIKFRIEP